MSGAPNQREFDDETSINHEIGIKSELLDSKLRLNATAFRSNFDDFQFLAQCSCPNGFCGSVDFRFDLDYLFIRYLAKRVDTRG